MRVRRRKHGSVVVVALAALLSAGLSGCHRIDTTTMPKMYVGLGVLMPMRATGGEGPLAWSATGLPTGLAIDPSTGVISGAPTETGSFSVVVSAVDPASNDATATTTYPLDVATPAPVDVVEPLGDGPSEWGPVISDDGRYVAYTSTDPQFRPSPEQAGVAYVVLDRVTRDRTLVFFDAAEYDGRLSLSADGRYVAFVDNPPTAGGAGRIGVWDRDTAATTFISAGTGPTPFRPFGPVLSDDGRTVAFVDSAGSGGYVAIHDLDTGTTQPVTSVPVQVEYAGLSGDGSTVAFSTPTAGVVPGDTNGRCDLFVWDRATGTTQRVTDNQLGDPWTVGSAPSVSADGATIAFGADLAGAAGQSAHLWERASGAVTPMPTRGSQPRISADGQRILYSHDGTGLPDGGSSLVVWDRPTGSVRRTGGVPYSARDFSFAGDGRHLVGGGGFFGPEMSVWDLLD